jgi:acetate CoA/acetoacetate CoA-transferase alpha subunit
MAMAGQIVMAEAEKIVPVGVIAPDDVMTAAVLVDRLIGRERAQVTCRSREIERLTLS